MKVDWMLGGEIWGFFIKFRHGPYSPSEVDLLQKGVERDKERKIGGSEIDLKRRTHWL
jgi:hypothetical protein